MNLLKTTLDRCLFPGLLLSSCLVSSGQVDWPQLKFTQVASGASVPTSIVDAGDGSGRLFVTEQSGRVLLMQSNSFVPFLDLQDRVHYIPGAEFGLLSVAFPPGFNTNHHFYAFYNSEPDGACVVSRFFVSSTNANVADPATEQQVLVVPPVEFSVSGGLLLFGPEGLLYIGMGDSGFLVSSPNQAQNPQSFQGKILRIDVEGSTNSYRVPSNNPFASNPAYLPEIWALGMRNPWRFTFDRATGDFYMGDVGQLESEEVNFKAAASPAGQNYGWPIREGFHLYAGPETTSVTLTDPIAEFLHTGPPSSITGGFVYRGPGPNRMTGIYFYADSYSGRIWGLKHDGTNWVTRQLVQTPYFITTFGENQAGQLYLANYISGKIYLIEDTGQAAAPAFNPPGTNSPTDTITLSSISTSAIIRYTTDGRDPVATDPGVNSGGTVVIGSGATLKARAFRDDLAPSPVTGVTYNLKAARPTFNPPYGPITNGQFLSIACTTAGATIRFTLDGTDPTPAASAYSAPFAYNGSLTLKACAFKAGFADSAVAVFSPVILQIQNFTNFVNNTFNSAFDGLSLPGHIYQVQVSEDSVQWRDFGKPQAGTGGTLKFNNIGAFPIPLRRLYRIKAVDDFGL